MSKFEIIIKADDELLAALNKLIAALEGKQVQPETTTVHSETPAAPEEKPVTLQQVRELLADKSQAGKQAEVKALITKYGAAKLTDIDPSQYSNLLKDAEGL